MTIHDVEHAALAVWLRSRAEANRAMGCDEAARQLDAMADKLFGRQGAA